jgi:hypothetical protein
VKYWQDRTALPLLKGLEFLERLGCNKVITESDSLELIQACNGAIEVRSPYSAIMIECFLKANSIDQVSFQHCYRDVNQVARELASFAYESKGIYNARCLGEMLRLINRFLVKHWCLYRLDRCLTKHLFYTNKHQCLAKCLIYFSKHPF